MTASDSSFKNRSRGRELHPALFSFDAEVRECPGRRKAGGVQPHLQRRNRSWTIEDYTAMLTHTILEEAHNTGAARRSLTNGIEFAQVIECPDAPDGTCQWMRGKVVMLGDSRLLNPYHPNCMGGLTPVFDEPADVRKMLVKR
jgi:hypothetical protein